MSELLRLAVALLAGIALGAAFFGGLWWTVRKGVEARQPALLFGVSLLLRTGLVLAGFYFVSDGRWRPMLACLLGFAAARAVATRLPGIRKTGGGYHAP